MQVPVAHKHRDLALFEHHEGGAYRVGFADQPRRVSEELTKCPMVFLERADGEDRTHVSHVCTTQCSFTVSLFPPDVKVGFFNKFRVFSSSVRVHTGIRVSPGSAYNTGREPELHEDF
jgi:hypothetical protein